MTCFSERVACRIADGIMNPHCEVRPAVRSNCLRVRALSAERVPNRGKPPML